MIVYMSRRFVVRRFRYGGSGIASRIGSLLTRYARKAMLATSAAKRAVPHSIGHKVASTIADAAKKRKRVDIDVKHN